MLFVVVGLSVAALAIGPLLLLAGRGRGAEAVVDGFALGAVLALILVAIVPHLYAELGVTSLLLLAAGYLLLALAEAAGDRWARGTTSLVIPALLLHSLLDGAALALAVQSDGQKAVQPPLVVALVVHRLAEGLAAGAVLLPRLAKRDVALCVAAMGVFTLIGASFGSEIVARLGDRRLHAGVAFGMGVILHLIGHGGARVVRNSRAAIAFVVGLVLALVVPFAFG